MMAHVPTTKTAIAYLVVLDYFTEAWVTFAHQTIELWNAHDCNMFVFTKLNNKKSEPFTNSRQNSHGIKLESEIMIAEHQNVTTHNFERILGICYFRVGLWLV